MSRTLSVSSRYFSQRLRRTLCLIFVLGLLILLFHLGTFTFHLLFKFLNGTMNNTKSVNLASDTTLDPASPTLCIVTRIYWAQIPYFPISALGLYHTGPDNIRIYVVNTDNQMDIQQLKQTIDFINDLVLRQDFVMFLDLGQPPDRKDFGYEMIDRALTYLSKQDENSSLICQYITFTNGVDFYSRNFVRKILPHMKTGKDIIAWGFVSHHYKPQYQEVMDTSIKIVPEVVDDGTEKCVPVELKSGFADLGAVTYRLSFLRKHNLHFSRSDGSYFHGSDGYFVEQASQRTNASIILRQTLFVHQ